MEGRDGKRRSNVWYSCKINGYDNALKLAKNHFMHHYIDASGDDRGAGGGTLAGLRCCSFPWRSGEDFSYV